jgi:hypothetical protein
MEDEVGTGKSSLPKPGLLRDSNPVFSQNMAANIEKDCGAAIS